MRRLLVLGTVVLLVAAACGGSGGEEAAPAWNHDPTDPTLGPDAWGGIDETFEQCSTGTAQSPVDISAAVIADLPPLELDYAATPLAVENSGHLLEVPMPDSSENTLTIEDDAYRLVQYHFHAPSEHTIDGESSAVEAHLVHENDAGELAVVSVLFDDGVGASNELLESVLTNAPEEAGEEVEIDDERSPLELLQLEGSSAEVPPTSPTRARSRRRAAARGFAGSCSRTAAVSRRRRGIGCAS